MTARRLIGYVRASGPRDPRPLDLQRDAIATACANSSWELVELIVEAPDSPPGPKRPRLREAISHLNAGRGDGLIVAAAQSLAHRVSSLVDLVAWLDKAGTALVILDPMLDTGERSGRSALDLLTALVAAEREDEQARHAGRQADGRGRGRVAVAADPELRGRITTMREAGMSLQAIADTLNTEGIATVRNGALWRASSVQAATGYRRPRPNQPPHSRLPPPPQKPPQPPAPGRDKR